VVVTSAGGAKAEERKVIGIQSRLCFLEWCEDSEEMRIRNKKNSVADARTQFKARNNDPCHHLSFNKLASNLTRHALFRYIRPPISKYLDSVQDSLVADFRRVSALDLRIDAVELHTTPPINPNLEQYLFSKGILTSSIQHLLLDLARIRRPIYMCTAH
jgi:hypothetical protein